MYGKGLLLGLAVMGLTGCESDPLSLGGEGEVLVGLSAEEGSPETSRSLVGSGDGEGSVEVTARVEVWTETDGWMELTSGAQTRTITAGSGEVSVLTTAQLEARTYSRVRVRFGDVRATGTGGAAIHLDVGSDGEAVVEREVELWVRSGAQAHLTINLNVESWLTDAEGGVVGEAAFASALQMSAE